MLVAPRFAFGAEVSGLWNGLSPVENEHLLMYIHAQHT